MRLPPFCLKRLYTLSTKETFKKEKMIGMGNNAAQKEVKTIGSSFKDSRLRAAAQEVGHG